MKSIMKFVGRAARTWRTRRDASTHNPKIPAFDAVAFAAVLEMMG